MRITGYGVIDLVASGKGRDKELELVEAGVIRPKASGGIAERLRKIYEALMEVTEELKPDVLVIEKLYSHYRHPVTAMLMGHARGVVCLISGVRRIPLVNLASTHVKKSVTGRGHAAKSQVQHMVQHHLRLKMLPKPPDVADALAVAISYAFTLKDKRGIL